MFTDKKVHILYDSIDLTLQKMQSNLWRQKADQQLAGHRGWKGVHLKIFDHNSQMGNAVQQFSHSDSLGALTPSPLFPNLQYSLSVLILAFYLRKWEQLGGNSLIFPLPNYHPLFVPAGSVSLLRTAQ